MCVCVCVCVYTSSSSSSSHATNTDFPVTLCLGFWPLSSIDSRKTSRLYPVSIQS